MELFGLKDKDGNEWRLNCKESWAKGCYYIENVTPLIKTPEPKFKVGDWVFYKNPENHKGASTFFRIAEIKETRDKGRYRVFDGDKDNWFGWYELSDCRLATKEEIEAHLRKIADEKYAGKKVRCLDIEYDVFCISKFDRYDFIRDGIYFDRLIYYSKEANRCIVVYDKGRWAEIIPEKKRLPKTKAELAGLIADFRAHNSLNGRLGDFLDQYED